MENEWQLKNGKRKTCVPQTTGDGEKVGLVGRSLSVPLFCDTRGGGLPVNPMWTTHPSIQPGTPSLCLPRAALDSRARPATPH